MTEAFPNIFRVQICGQKCSDMKIYNIFGKEFTKKLPYHHNYPYHHITMELSSSHKPIYSFLKTHSKSKL